MGKRARGCSGRRVGSGGGCGTINAVVTTVVL